MKYVKYIAVAILFVVCVCIIAVNVKVALDKEPEVVYVDEPTLEPTLEPTVEPTHGPDEVCVYTYLPDGTPVENWVKLEPTPIPVVEEDALFPTIPGTTFPTPLPYDWEPIAAEGWRHNYLIPDNGYDCTVSKGDGWDMEYNHDALYQTCYDLGNLTGLFGDTTELTADLIDKGDGINVIFEIRELGLRGVYCTKTTEVFIDLEELLCAN